MKEPRYVSCNYGNGNYWREGVERRGVISLHVFHDFILRGSSRFSKSIFVAYSSIFVFDGVCGSCCDTRSLLVARSSRINFAISAEFLYHAQKSMELDLLALDFLIAALLSERGCFGLKCINLCQTVLLGLVLVDVFCKLLKLLLVLFELALVL